MDTITALAVSINNPLLHAADQLVANDLLYILTVLALLLIFESRNAKRLKVLSSLAIATMIGYMVKLATAIPRPCAGTIACPLGYSFPSLHAVIAFTLMTGFLNKKSFPLFMIFALFVSFTRLNLGVHVFDDIAGALPISLVAYYITDLGWSRWRRGVDNG